MMERRLIVILRAAYDLVSSRIILLWLSGAWCVYYIFTAVWMNESFGQFVVNLQTKTSFNIPFVLFIISGWSNICRIIFEKIKKGGIFQMVLSATLPVGLMLFITGYYFSLTMRQFDWIGTGQGEEIILRWSNARYRVERVDAGMRERVLDIDLGSDKSIFKYEPKVTVFDESGRSHTIGAFPAKKIDGTYFHILNFGLAPGVRIINEKGEMTEGYVTTRIIAGGSDNFEVQPYPYRFLVTMEPEKIIEKGNIKASEFNISHPVFNVRVFRGENMIAEGMSSVPIRFDNLSLTFFDPVVWVTLEAVKDRAYPVVVSGMFIICLGIPLSLFGFVLDRWRRRASVQSDS